MSDVAVVTGASTGIGMHAAIALALEGNTVVATMRDPTRDERLQALAAQAGVELDVRALDVTDEAACRDVVAAVIADHGRVDVLLNNAGRGSVGTAEQLSEETIRDQLEVNYLGPVRLTRLVLPGMRSAGRGRILTVTSVGGAVGQPFADAYCGAKFAVEGFMQSLAVVALRFGVRVSVVEPAAVASEFVANVVRPDDSGPYAELLDAYIARTGGAYAAAQSGESAGRAIADAVMASDYRFRWQTSPSAEQFVSLSLADVDGSRVIGQTSTWIAPPEAQQ